MSTTGSVSRIDSAAGTTDGGEKATMPDWLFERSTVIALAIAGGVFSVLASLCQSRGWVTEHQLKMLNRAAYAFMGASIILFVLVGLLGLGSQAH